MDANKLHLLLNHYPMIASLFGTILLVVGLAMSKEKVTKGGLWILVVVSILTLPVHVSGEISGGAMGLGLFADAINQHKQSARQAFILIEISGIFSLISLILLARKPQLAKWMIYVLLLISFGSTALVTQTTLKGRQIKHALSGTETPQQTNVNK